SRRYTEPEIASFLDNPDVKMILLQAEDRFGAVGNSGLIIYRKAGNTAEVDTLLMSCRIIGRGVDHALFCESLRRLAASSPDHASQTDFLNWDSVHHMNVVLALENDFEIEFDDAELPTLTSVPRMVAAIEKHIAG